MHDDLMRHGSVPLTMFLKNGISVFGVLLVFILLNFLSASLTHPFSLLRPIYRFTAIDTNNNEGHLA